MTPIYTRVCTTHNIQFITIEQEFPSRSAALMWILDNQLARRNINQMTRKDLIGRRYSEEKKAVGTNRYTTDEVSKGASNLPSKKTAEKIGNQVGMSHQGVKDAEKFSQAIDLITVNTGISRSEILTGKIKCTQDDIKELAELEIEIQRKVITKTIEDKDDVHTAISKVRREERERLQKEVEEKKRQMEAQLKLEREEKEKLERERLRVEREEKARMR